jgi:hypothetical protein
MRKLFPLALLFLSVGATSVFSDELLKYKLVFTVTGGSPKAPPTGEFVYDLTLGKFQSFLISWDGLTNVDYTVSFNGTLGGTPSNPPQPEYCTEGNTLAEINFLSLTEIGCNGDLLQWYAMRQYYPLPSPPTSFNYVMFSCPLNWTHYGLAGRTGTSGNENAEAEGTFTVQQVIPSSPPNYATINQIVRAIAGPVFVPPGVPVEVNIGFVDVNGIAIGPSSTVPLTAGQTAILDLDANMLVQAPGQRVLVRPVVTSVRPPSTAAVLTPPQVPLNVVTEVFDKATGFGTMLVPATEVPANPVFEFQGLAGGQTMQLIVTAAVPTDPCFATLSFQDRNGNTVGQSMPVNLQPGQSTFLNLNANTIGLAAGQRIELQPIVTETPSTNSSCQAKTEVFDNLTGRTWTYQVGGAKTNQ